jgi:hypothetical protein
MTLSVLSGKWLLKLGVPILFSAASPGCIYMVYVCTHVDIVVTAFLNRFMQVVLFLLSGYIAFLCVSFIGFNFLSNFSMYRCHSQHSAISGDLGCSIIIGIPCCRVQNAFLAIQS